jgi:hypothetical protein
MAHYAWVWKEIGVDGDPWRRNESIPVPIQGSTLVMMRGANGRKPDYDKGSLDVRVVEPSDVLMRFEEYLKDLAVSGSARQDLLNTMLPPVKTEVSNGSGKLLLVTGKTHGPTYLGAGAEQVVVQVIPGAFYTLSFRFLQKPDFQVNPDWTQGELAQGARVYSNAAPDMKVTWTTRTLAEVDDWISNLNWIFGSQANITFQLGTKEPFHLDSPIAAPDKSASRRLLDSKKDQDASFTMFMVGYVNEPPAAAWSNVPPTAGTGPGLTAMLPDHPKAPTTGSDPFMVTLAHELSHCIDRDLGDDWHFDTDGILRSTKIQSTKIGGTLRDQLVKPKGGDYGKKEWRAP